MGDAGNGHLKSHRKSLATDEGPGLQIRGWSGATKERESLPAEKLMTTTAGDFLSRVETGKEGFDHQKFSSA